MNELTIDETIERGRRGARVRIIQEWLTLHDLAVVIDGDVGPATQEAVRRFQRRKGLAATGALATGAKARNVFLSESELKKGAALRPGAFFPNRRTATDWVHTGIVIGARDGAFDTIEGNTNDEGSREGYEVCRRVRGYAGKDFIVV